MGVVVGEPRDVVVERVEPRGREHPHLPHAAAELAHFIRHGVSKTRTQRYRSVTEMLDRLRSLDDGQCPVECPQTLAKRLAGELSRAASRRPRAVLAGVAVTGALSLLGVLSLLT